MTWEPTHVQFTVLRARNLVGKIKGKSSAKITDVFVSIALGKEKFQTSTIKYGNKMGNQAEWFEECDLLIPNMEMEVEVNVMNRGLLSDEFIGYATVPLHGYSVYDRPKSHWLQLHQKPTKLPDGRCRGELEVRLTFHVKSREETSPGTGLKGKRAGSIKSLVNAVGDKLGKITRSRSLRGDGNQNFSTPQTHRQDSTHSKPSAHSTNPPSLNSSVNFEAVDLYVPEQCWRDNEFTFDDEDLGDGNFARSYSLTSDKRRNNRDFKSRSLLNLPSDRSLTLPNPRRGRQRPSLDDSAIARTISTRSSRGSVTSQEGYLENMFRKECEVDDRMGADIEEVSESDGEGGRKQAKPFNVFGTSSESESSTESETDQESDQEQITLPKVKLKENPVVNGRSQLSLEQTIEKMNALESDVRDSEYHSAESQAETDEVFKIKSTEYTTELDRVIAREASRHNTDTLNSQGSSDEATSSHHSSSSQVYEGKSAKERARERGSTDSLPERRKISPNQDFSFTGTSQVSPEDNSGSQKSRSKLYAKGGRRYTIQGLAMSNTHKSAPDIRNQRPVYQRDDSIPENLLAVYNNMNREELIRLVVTHKAQLIRKDQYIKDLETYIDSLLVRVMESSPRILQNL